MSAGSGADAGGREPLADVEELAANMLAVRTFALWAQTPLIWALVQRGAVDLERVLANNRVLVDLFRQNAATTTGGPVVVRSHALISEMLSELDAVIRNMGTKPSDAGHA
jgi:hypothetical protein